MVPFLKTTTARVLALLVLVFAAYTLAGFLLAPRLVRSLMIENVQKSLGVTPVVGDITVNPLRLRIEVHDFLLPAANGDRLIGFERLSVSARAASLWRLSLVFGDIEIDAPFVNASVGRDGALNLAQLHPKSPPPDHVDQSPPRIQIGLFKVNRGLLTYEDRTRNPAFETRLEPIEFDLRDFSTGADGGLFHFTARTRDDERIEWHGHISVAPLESDGEIKLTGLLARTIWQYIEGRVNFAVTRGNINIDASYRLAIKGSTELHVDLHHLDVTGLGVMPKGGGADWVSVQEGRVGPASLDVVRGRVDVDAVVFKGLQVSTWLEPDRSLNLARLVAPPSPAPESQDAGWQVSLKKLVLDGADIAFEDRSVTPVAKFALAPLSLEVRGASLDLAKPLDVKLDTDINATGHVGVVGSVTPAPLSATVAMQLSKFDLATLQPYIATMTSLILQRGRLSADLKLRYGGSRPGVTATGGVGVEDLHTIDKILGDDFLNWQSLQVNKLSYQQQPSRVELDRVVVRKLYSRAIIEADSTLNVQRVLAPTKSTTPTGPAPQRAPMFIAIHAVDIGDSAVNFSDLSINPHFSAGIQKLHGSVNGLSSQPGSRAKVDLKGEVDTFSPVSIAGDVNLLGPKLYTDIAMSFHDIELSIINPYSGKFAGYNITKGKLTTELRYRLDGRKLDAQHHIRIDQLEFGAQTASKDAVSLPVKLAVAMMKDRNGVIDLDLPVSGSLDDPQFRLWPIIGKVLLRTIEKLITAPFALLGSLFSGGPDLQFVDFPPGSFDLDAKATERLKAIAKALAERPQLKLDVPIAFIPAIDAPAMKSAKLDAQLQAAQKTKRGLAPSQIAQLDSAAQLALLRAVYVATAGAEPNYPDAVATANGKGDADGARRDFLRRELLGRILVSDNELLELGRQRALALQRALLTDTQLDPERVFLVSSDKAKPDGDAVRLEMSLH